MTTPVLVHSIALVVYIAAAVTYGANLTLLDGHVERVSFKKLWQIDAAKKVVHSFWYMED